MYSASENKLIHLAVGSIIREQMQNGGRIPRGVIPDVINTLEEQGIRVTRDVLNGRIRRCLAKDRSKSQQVPSAIATIEGCEATTVSDLTNSTTGTTSTSHNTGQGRNNEYSDRTWVGVRTFHDSESIEQFGDLNTFNSSTNLLDDNSNSRGRPKGSTNKAHQGMIEKKKKLINEVSIEYAAKLMEKKHRMSSRLPKGYLEHLIEQKKHDLDVQDDVTISLSTIRSRPSCKSLTPHHQGTPSPLQVVESVVIPVILQMARIRQPMRPPEVIALVNSFIDGTVHQQHLIAWKKIHQKHQSGENLGQVGPGYLKRFMQRYGKYLESSAARRFAINRSEWLKPAYLEDMYNAIYSIFVAAGIAYQVQEPVAYDFYGSLVEVGSPLQYGLPSNIVIEHRDYILFGDETGINTNQLDDGKVGGTKYIVPHGCVPLLQGNTSDHRATVLPITSASGEPVVCAVVFASDRPQVESSWHSGIDITINPVFDEDGNIDINNPDNHGPGKYFPCGPVCHFRGKAIPTLTFTSPSAAISGDILVQIFKALDDMELYPRGCNNEGQPYPEPCVVVDGHDSRLKTDFLVYINDQRHKWNFCLGVPYLTHLWQVGDSPEQNGNFKAQLARAKEELMSFKLQRGMVPKLNSTDIIPLLNIAWGKSFAHVESNRHRKGSFENVKCVLHGTRFSCKFEGLHENLINFARI